MNKTLGRMFRSLSVVVLAASLLACSGTDPDAGNSAVAGSGDAVQDNDEFAVTGAWIRAAPPGTMMLAGYFTLENRGAGSRRLFGADSDAFSDVSIHRSFMEDGMSKMRPAGKLSIGSGESLRFEPGGLHLMLMSPTAAVASGQRIPVRLYFEDGKDVLVDFTVRSEAP